MTDEIITVFARIPSGLPLYEAAEKAILDMFPDVRIKATKTQVSFSNRYGFAYVWPPLRKVKGWPPICVILTFGLGHRVVDPRIVEAVEPYPGRWTHHVLISKPEDIDAQVLDWLRQAYFFSMTK